MFDRAVSEDSVTAGCEPRDLDRLIILIGGVRSGTTVLRRMLASHPRIVDQGEIFNSGNASGFYAYCKERLAADLELIYPERQPDIFLSYLASRLPADPRCLALLDIKYQHLGLIAPAWGLPFDPPLLLQLLRSSKAMVIHLRRQNFRSVVSNLVALQSGRYRSDEATPPATGPRPDVRIGRRYLLSRMHRRGTVELLIDETFDRKRLHALDYEKLFDGEGLFRPQVTERMAAFLGFADQFERRPALRKMIDRPLAEVVINYREIRALEVLDLVSQHLRRRWSAARGLARNLYRRWPARAR